VETPEAPGEGNATRFGRAAEARGLAAATWAGRGDERRGISLLGVGAAGGLFISLFMPWFGFGGHTESGWNLPLGVEVGLLALAVALVELLWLARAWVSPGSEVFAFCLVAGAALFGVSEVANVRWGGLTAGGFSPIEYGAWLGLALAVLLVTLAVLRWTALRRSAP
jgi:hypothetical protein